MDLPRQAWRHAQRIARGTSAIVWRAGHKYVETDGEQRAASFGFYAFFALFPLMLVLIAVGTMFFGNKEVATEKIVNQIERYIPLEARVADTQNPGSAGRPDSAGGKKQSGLFRLVSTVVRTRGSAGLIAGAVLAWSALRFFQALVHGVNRAWGTKDYPWWRIPFKNLAMVAILTSALVLGIVAPHVINHIEYYFWNSANQVGLNLWFAQGIFPFARELLQWLILFYGLVMFYKLAPRRRTTLREIWMPALAVAGALYGLQWLFALYVRNFGHFNAIYGAFGGAIALLMWIYLTGSLIIFGGCLCAAQHERRQGLGDQSVSNFD